jgi:hypothetical protein
VASIQQQIRDSFLTKLAESAAVDADKIAKLRELMGNGKKLKADDIVKLFSSTSDGLA